MNANGKETVKGFYMLTARLIQNTFYAMQQHLRDPITISSPVFIKNEELVRNLENCFLN